MEPKNNPTIKSKRGRKSKKELMESLSISPITKLLTNTSTNDKSIQLNVDECVSCSSNSINNTTVYNDILNINDNILPFTPINDSKSSVITPLPIKKRGRKPKGGKIIQPMLSNIAQNDDKPNIILHLKCSLKDLITTNQNNYLLNSYNFGNKNELMFDILNGENGSSDVAYNNSIVLNMNVTDDNNDNDFDENCKDKDKDIGKKLKQLEQNLHLNHVINTKSACFWDTCEFDNSPIYIPKYFMNGTYHVYGCFCSPECAVAHLMSENIDSSVKFERYHLLNHIYSKVYDYTKNIKPAPDPHYMLEKYCGNLSIQEYRSLLRNERLYLIIDKPLTRVLPELHEDNDDFILNNKIIPSNYQVKTRLQRKKQNKNNILNEKFGITNINTTIIE
jgi:hypothetical protein